VYDVNVVEYFVSADETGTVAVELGVTDFEFIVIPVECNSFNVTNFVILIKFGVIAVGLGFLLSVEYVSLFGVYLV